GEVAEKAGLTQRRRTAERAGGGAGPVGGSLSVGHQYPWAAHETRNSRKRQRTPSAPLRETVSRTVARQKHRGNAKAVAKQCGERSLHPRRVTFETLGGVVTVVRIPFERHRLDNGLRVVLSRDDSAPIVAVNLWYNVGSRNEEPGRTGFAHLFEHMMFQGSANVPETGHFALIEKAGGSLNGSTWLDRTNYFETVPAHYLDLALWLEADRMGWLLPAMTQEKLDNQRDVVKNE